MTFACKEKKRSTRQGSKFTRKRLIFNLRWISVVKMISRMGLRTSLIALQLINEFLEIDPVTEFCWGLGSGIFYDTH